jgi:hypothetical protein
MTDKDREWLEAMLEDWKQNRKLYDALATEYFSKDKVKKTA